MIKIENLYAYDVEGKEKYDGNIHFEGLTSKEIEELISRADYKELESKE